MYGPLAAGGGQTRRVVQDRCQATAVLTRAGMSAAKIAVRLGVTQRTVQRYRQRLKLEEAERGAISKA